MTALRIGIAVLLLSAWPANTMAAPRPRVGTIAGTVLSAKGVPVAGASVTIQTAEGSHPHATTSDIHGHFAFTRYARGQYDLRAYSSGTWSDWARDIPVKSGKTTQLELRLNVSYRK